MRDTISPHSCAEILQTESAISVENGKESSGKKVRERKFGKVPVRKFLKDSSGNPPEFLALPVSLPDLPEQRAIADILDTCDKELRLLRGERAAIDRQKRGLMQRLLTGRTRVGENTD